MPDPTSTSAAAGAAYLAAKGATLKAAAGMVGAALLFVLLPPRTADGKLNTREFAARLAAAGVVSAFFGDWSLELLVQHLPSLHAENHRAAVYLITGAPAWWVGRAIALWFARRRDRDIAEQARDAAADVRSVVGGEGQAKP